MYERFLILMMTLLLSIGSSAQDSSLDAARLYNEGIAAYEQNDMAKAIYNLELAHMLLPYDKEIKHNLRIAKSKVDVDIVEIDGFFLSEWIQGAANCCSPGLWRYGTLLLLLVLLAMLYGRLVKGYQRAATSWLAIGLLGALILLTGALGLTREKVLTGGRYGIVMSESMQLKEGPDPVSADVKEVSAGVKVELLDEVGEWYKVAAMDREQGWLRADQVKILVLTN